MSTCPWRRSDFGCMMSINPDAYSIAELDHMHWGVEIARKEACHRPRC